MDKINIQELLQKYKDGSISSEELILLETWYLQWQPENLDISHQELLAMKEEVWKAVAPAKHKTIWPRVAAVAASLLILISVSAYYLLHTPTKTQPLANKEVYDFKPGSNKAILTLSNGKTIILTDTKNGNIANQGDVTITKKENGELVYGKSSNQPTEILYNTMTTARGGQYQITLSDGTKAWMNAASSITYPVAFPREERKIVVTGEVYFEVAKNENKPFKVLTDNQEITVLGTSFNINGYADETAVNTTLLAGSIKIKNLTSGKSRLLTPGQQAIIENDQINIKSVNAGNAISWKNGYFLFDNQDIKSIMKTISRWYDVDIEYKNHNQNERFGGTFSRASNLSETLHNLEQIGHIHFNIQAKKIIVTD
jgi:transmembrane sensor